MEKEILPDGTEIRYYGLAGTLVITPKKRTRLVDSISEKSFDVMEALYDEAAKSYRKIYHQEPQELINER